MADRNSFDSAIDAAGPIAVEEFDFPMSALAIEMTPAADDVLDRWGDWRKAQLDHGINSTEHVDAERALSQAIHDAFGPDAEITMPRAVLLPRRILIALPWGVDVEMGRGDQRRLASVFELSGPSVARV